MLKRYAQALITAFICSDILLILLIWIVLYLVAGHFSSTRIVSPENLPDQLKFFLIFIPVYLVCAYKLDFYAPRRFSNYYTEFIKVSRLVSFAIIISFFIGYVLRIFYHDHIFILVFWAVCVFSIFVYHILVEYILKYLRLRGFNLRRILIIGSGDLAKRSALKFFEHREFGLNVIGCLTDHGTSDNMNIPVLGSYDELHKIILQKSVDIVFFALQANEEKLIRSLIERIDNISVDIKVALDIDGLFLMKNGVSEIDGIPIITLRGKSQVVFKKCVKRLFDIIFAVVVILLVTPFSFLVAILIKISSSGPVFYIQERVSLNGKKFRLIKFRTMKENAEAHTGPVWTSEDDPRRTAIGVWLRKTGMDELPQFLNVLKGEMSIVGPRPERPEFIEEFRKIHPYYMFRQSVVAGITGLAQIHGLRGNTPLEERLKYDLEYLNHWSLRLDIKIILMTVLEIFKGKGT